MHQKSKISETDLQIIIFHLVTLPLLFEHVKGKKR